MPLISVIIPVYNHEKMLRRALASVWKQNFRPLQVIVVDDGSEPAVSFNNFRSLLPEKLPDDFSLLTHRQKNRGASATRNAGFLMSSGDFVIFWDADIVAPPDFLEKLFQALKKNNKAGYAYCDFNFGWKKMKTGPFSEKKLLDKNFITTTSLIRREAFPGFDESLKRFQDWDLWLALLKKKITGQFVNDCFFHATPRKKGISSWLPSFAYKKPWSALPWWKTKVKNYFTAKEIILKKHHCLFDDAPPERKR